MCISELIVPKGYSQDLCAFRPQGKDMGLQSLKINGNTHNMPRLPNQIMILLLVKYGKKYILV